jgi:hypothetical protein
MGELRRNARDNAEGNDTKLEGVATTDPKGGTLRHAAS